MLKAYLGKYKEDLFLDLSQDCIRAHRWHFQPHMHLIFSGEVLAGVYLLENIHSIIEDE